MDWHSLVLHECDGEEDLEVKHQVGNQVMPLSDIRFPVFMYGCETWATTKHLHSCLDAFDMWALCKILRILYSIQYTVYTRHMSNVEVRGTTGCSPLFHLVTNRRLRLFRHTAHSSPRKDHHRAAAVAIRQVPPNWKRPIGRPIYLIKPIGSVQLRQTWAH